ncbi:hypothetical protein [Paraburkholderia caribensis]|uniref:hypothetical protein n=1 Tax=Paraburkholderia caribensis TaxID=75105 RepID=UPI001CB2C43C|nr:hypothetical protein [Paraburkholderia caribensis]CAG9243786.1 membrane hypothetical protein [Paraburkholderia caribensis]
MFVRRPVTRWVTGGLGVLAVVMGTFGAINPAAQAGMMGLLATGGQSLGGHTAELLVITSLAAVNTGTLYLVGAVKQWSGFVAWAMTARFIMGAGLLALVLSAQAPHAFIGAAAWEWLGAMIIGLSCRWDRGRATIYA